MTDEEFSQLLAIGHEARGVEWKAPGRRDDGAFFAEVTRAALGMANRRDGGTIVLGILEEKGQPPQFVGVSLEVEATWGFDDCSTGFARYAEPNLTFEIAVRKFDDRRFVVIVVEEFDSTPILCKEGKRVAQGVGRPEREILRRGALYVRSRRKPETSEIATLEDMQILLELAVDKGVKKFVERARLGGLIVPGTETSRLDPRYSIEIGGPWE